MVVTVDHQSSLFPYNTRRWAIFNCRFTKFMLGSSEDIKFMIIVEDLYTGDPSSVTVSKEYLFTFQF